MLDDFATPYDKILPIIVAPRWHVLPCCNTYALLLRKSKENDIRSHCLFKDKSFLYHMTSYRRLPQETTMWKHTSKITHAFLSNVIRQNIRTFITTRHLPSLLARNRRESVWEKDFIELLPTKFSMPSFVLKHHDTHLVLEGGREIDRSRDRVRDIEYSLVGLMFGYMCNEYIVSSSFNGFIFFALR